MSIIYRNPHIFNNSFVLLQITDPDCYKFVTNREDLSTVPKYTTTSSAPMKITSDKLGSG